MELLYIKLNKQLSSFIAIFLFFPFINVISEVTNTLQTEIPSGSLIWRIGIPDNQSNEFSDYKKGIEEVKITAENAIIEKKPQISKGLKFSLNPAMNINYILDNVPKYGALFSVKIIGAEKSGAQMAVFSNDIMVGLIQMWGVFGTNSLYPWRKTYRLYIPGEMLKKGNNVLQLRTIRPMWCEKPDSDHLFWWEWDYIKLECLDKPISEPWHGSVIYLGTTVKMSEHGFDINDNTICLASLALPWLGIAYSGNTIRADFWWDVTASQPRRLEYLKKLAEMNMSVVVDYISGNHFKNNPDGTIPQRFKDDIKTFFSQYGKYIQFYELGNEPCMFGNKDAGGYEEYLSLVKYLKEIKPSHVKLVAPGWAYGGGKGGFPLNWDADVKNRREIEKYCDFTNGHSYGFSYADNKGGSFVENLETYQGTIDGWPKPYLNTETGTNNWHSEENGPKIPSTQPKIQAFDRIMRAHIAVVDRTMQHALIFGEYGLIMERSGNWNKLEEDLTENTPPDGKGKDSRLKTFRRLALAYATHGAPIPYKIINSEENKGKMLYFRAVDTSKIPPLPGSNARSNKILLNFVNFEKAPGRLIVDVDMPYKTEYVGERFDSSSTLKNARSNVKMDAKNGLVIKEKLGPGESIQYILEVLKPTANYVKTETK
ncbi:MAG TPA: hypothetical protein PLN24_00795 [Victivallales bacterium]|nr:hypothetical protein [Victivallales bacterium]HPO90968.1 hypothetical protein [Victivallales bacterium]